MEKEQRHHSELFTLRLWQEDLGNNQVAWRGKVQHVTSGEASYFQDCTTLLTFLLRWFPGSEAKAEVE
ncbi:MAG: hypothetical protein NVS4B12_13200 [Ktedonobacteraceae bacterium]